MVLVESACHVGGYGLWWRAGYIYKIIQHGVHVHTWGVEAVGVCGGVELEVHGFSMEYRWCIQCR